MTSEYILLFLGKHRFKIILYNLFLFAIITGLSYYFTGRNYKANIDFYIINSSFAEGSIDDSRGSKLFPTAEEIEIIGSISKSNELFDSVVSHASLSKYYQSQSANDAIEHLKNKTSINIGKKGKITVTIEDNDSKKAQQIAKQIMNSLYNSFIEKSKLVRLNTQLDLVNRINYYSFQKEKILNDHLTNKNITKDILEVPLDSMYNYEVLNRIKTKTGLDFKEILSIISNIKRITEIDSRVFTLNDNLNKAEQNIKSLSRNNLIVLNNAMPYNKCVPWYEHINTGLKFTFLLNALWISCLLIYRHYQKEIDLFLKSNKS